MSEKSEVALEIQPIPPQTVPGTRAELQGLIETALREAGREDLLSNGELRLQIEQAFPTDQVIVILVTALSGVAVKTYNELILPKLRERYGVKEKKKEPRKSQR